MIKEVMSTPSKGLNVAIPKMILQYLIHCGYTDSATTFANAILAGLKPNESILASIQHRQQIIVYIMNGEIDKAISTIHTYHPECLKSREDILFQLKYYRFIQMILTDSPENTIKYGRENFAYDDPQVIENQQILEDIFSLLAYPDPKNSPVSYLFSSSFREKLAKAINGAILGNTLFLLFIFHLSSQSSLPLFLIHFSTNF